MRLQDTKNVKAMIDRMNAQGGTEVVANPELAGDEAALTGLEVAGTKYKVGGTEPMSTFLLHWEEDFYELPEVKNEENIATLNKLREQFFTLGYIPTTLTVINEYMGEKRMDVYGVISVGGTSVDGSISMNLRNHFNYDSTETQIISNGYNNKWEANGISEP